MFKSICKTFFGWTLLSVAFVSVVQAQNVVSEDFTNQNTDNSWYVFGGACLTAGPSTGTSGTVTIGTNTVTLGTTSVAGSPPGCVAIDSTYYGGEPLVGGAKGVAGNSQTLPDTSGSGALRFTNGCTYSSSTACSSTTVKGSGTATGATNTYTAGGGHNQRGSIVSGTTFDASSGVQVTFKTVTYRGDSQGNGQSTSTSPPYNVNDGADGISFFLLAAADSSSNTIPPNIGAYGGSLGYTCSMTNTGHDGMYGAYIGLGIDEYGNFLNGAVVSSTSGSALGPRTTSAFGYGDNTATGAGQYGNRIGLRGAGNVAWNWMSSSTYNPTYASYYQTSTYTGNSANQQLAVGYTCENGYLSDYQGHSILTTGTASVNDYAPIPGASQVLSNITLGNEYSKGGYARTTTGNNVMMYKLKITSSGLLTFSYSSNGAAWQPVITNQSITTSNGSLPSTLRFGFAGSTGGASNIHEVLCFKATSADTSGSSTSTNEKQTAEVENGSQAYFAYYDPNDWTGRLTANALTSDSSGNLTIASTATWDAACVLTGATKCANTGVATTVEAPTSRVILTWNGTQGVPFECSSTTCYLNAAQQTAMEVGDTTANTPAEMYARVSFLRGDRTNEVNTSGVGYFRDRDFVLGDVIDSAPTAVGQPVSPYSVTWSDRYDPTDTMAEAGSSAQTYAAYFAKYQTRLNVVYVGANDGLLHGFEAGSFDTSNKFVSTYNDGKEVLAYMPGSMLQSAANTSTPNTPSTSWPSNCTGNASGVNAANATQSWVQNIHGETPTITSASGTTETNPCVNTALDYSSVNYGHNFFVDGSPGTGDLFYANNWHTWLVSGFGAGGAGIFALDVTDPTTFTESTANAKSVVIGEWNQATLPTCTNASGSYSCNSNLGNTYGTPVIRRLHDGNWAVIWGNGIGSSTGDAGIYIMTIGASSGTQTLYYLSTGQSSGAGDGIAYVTPVDLDGDHITDYIYAGDVLGNVWRFDLTSTTETSWAASSKPIFQAGSAQPITSGLLVAAITGNSLGTQVMVAFGTGQKIPLTNTTSVSYASGAQYLYAFWDTNFATWNGKSAFQYGTVSSPPTTLTPSNLTLQTATLNSTTNTVDISASTICWASSSASSSCSGTPTSSYGWYFKLPNSTTNYNEQIIYSPQLTGNVLTVNSIIPAYNPTTACATNQDSGYTYGVVLGSGAAQTGYFINSSDTSAAGVQSNATGTSYVVTTSTTTSSANIYGGTAGTTNGGGGGGSSGSNSSPFASIPGCTANDTYLVYQTTSGTGSYTRIAPKCVLSGARTTWTQLR